MAWTKLPPPRSLMAPIDAATADALVAASPLLARYGQEIDRESAYELLAAKVIAPQPAPPAPAPRHVEEKSAVEKVLGNTAVRGVLRAAATTAAREILRGMFGTALRRR